MFRQKPIEFLPVLLALFCLCCSGFHAWTTTTLNINYGQRVRSLQSSSSAISESSSWFSPVDNESGTTKTSTSVDQLKFQLLQLGAALDRGQAYNPTSGLYYEENMNVARSKIEQLLDIAATAGNAVPKSLEEIEGEWELVLSTVPHGIFRSSPFFLAIQVCFLFWARASFLGITIHIVFF